MTSAHWSSALDILERLVSFDTVSHRSNLDCVNWIEAYLASHGVASQKVFSPDGEKANIFCTIGPADQPGVVLSGHTDVVPVTDQIWTSDPFTLTRRDGLLFGRGTTDMKGFVAACLALVPTMVKANLQKPIHIALSYDEEYGQRGVPLMIKEMTAQLPPGQLVIVGEATDLKPVIGHKGNLVFFTDVKGKTFHSSRMDLGLSAIHIAGRLITWLDARMKRNRDEAGPSQFAPPYTTLHCGIINGGHAPNVIADQCRFVTEIRALPGEDPERFFEEYRDYIRDEILPEMHEIAPESDVVITRRSKVPGLDPVAGGPAEALIRDLTGYNGPPLVVTYGTEGGQFQEAGWQSVVCGPGDIAQAHQADEFISEADLDRCLGFLETLVEHCA